MSDKEKAKKQTAVTAVLRLDVANAQVWCGERLLKLTPRAFAVLHYLSDHAGRLVTKDELMQTVWTDTVVTDGALATSIRELRKALDDDAQSPQYIETVHRRGYRFIGQLRDPQGRTPSLTAMGHQQRAGEGREVARRLVAILSADVQGYSLLMSADEVATVRTLTAYREVLTSLIHRHRGRVVDAPGDNVLAEFASVVDAVEGAVAIQQILTERNAALPLERRMAFRIGINVGDVVVEDERIYGEGVNLAARLEGLAEAGGLCISGTAYEQVKNKVALVYEDLGERRVKNIVEPVRVYRVKWEPEGGARQSSAPTSSASSRHSSVVSKKETVSDPQLTTENWPLPTRVVGRHTELSQLHAWLAKALNGERQLVFITGEAGIGKTTLVETFVCGVRSSASQQENQKSKGKSQKSKISNPQPLTPSTQEAEACFLKAIKVARCQGAKSFELQAAISLARLWQQHGKRKQAHNMLARSTTGSLKDLRPKTCKRRRRCCEN
jgi:class 3 adenylate cyclase